MFDRDGGLFLWRIEEIVLRPDWDMLVMQVREPNVQRCRYCLLVLCFGRSRVRGPGLLLFCYYVLLSQLLALPLNLDQYLPFAASQISYSPLAYYISVAIESHSG